MVLVHFIREQPSSLRRPFLAADNHQIWDAAILGRLCHLHPHRLPRGFRTKNSAAFRSGLSLQRQSPPVPTALRSAFDHFADLKGLPGAGEQGGFVNIRAWVSIAETGS